MGKSRDDIYFQKCFLFNVIIKKKYFIFNNNKATTEARGLNKVKFRNCHF